MQYTHTISWFLSSFFFRYCIGKNLQFDSDRWLKTFTLHVIFWQYLLSILVHLWILLQKWLKMVANWSKFLGLPYRFGKEKYYLLKDATYIWVQLPFKVVLLSEGEGTSAQIALQICTSVLRYCKNNQPGFKLFSLVAHTILLIWLQKNLTVPTTHDHIVHYFSNTRTCVYPIGLALLIQPNSTCSLKPLSLFVFRSLAKMLSVYVYSLPNILVYTYSTA
jgi:hypothetical protein